MGASGSLVGDLPVAGAGRELPDDRETSWTRMAVSTFLSRTGLVALGLVVLQLLWRGRAVSGGFYNQDDFLNLRAARDANLDRAHLLDPLAGELSPVGRLLQWVTVNVGDTSWTSVTVFVLVLQTVAALLTWVVISQLLPDRWLRIPLFIVALFTPLTLPAVFSWSAASIHLPLTLAVLVATSALLAHQAHGWSSGPTVAVLAVVVALLSSDRAVVLPVVLFLLVAAVRDSGVPGARRRLADTFRALPWVWGAMVAAVVVRLVHGMVAEGTSLGVPQGSSVASDVVEQYVRQVVWGLPGGPWGGDWSGAVLVPERGGAFVLALVACSLAAVPLLHSRRHPGVRVALLGLVATVVLSLVLAFSTSSDLLAIGMLARRGADAALYFVLFAAAAFRSARFPSLMRYLVPRSSVLASVLVAVVLLLSSLVTTRALVPHLANEEDRGYVEAMATGLSGNPATVLLEDPTPEWIIHPWFGDDARISTVASLLPEKPMLDVPSEHLRKVDSGGHLREVDLESQILSRAQGRECAHTVRSSGTDVVFEVRTPDQRQVLQFDYLVGQDTFMRMQAGDTQFRFALNAGMSRVQVPLRGGFDRVRLSLDPAAGELSACLGLVQVGTPVEAPFRGVQ